jgi:hypothetical protein
MNRDRSREDMVCYDVLVLTFEESRVMQKAWLVCLASLERRNASEKLARTVRLAILKSTYTCCGSRPSRWFSAQVLKCNRVQKRHRPWFKQALAPTRPHPFSGVSYVAKCSRLQTEECWSIDVTRTVDGWISEPDTKACHAT